MSREPGRAAEGTESCSSGTLGFPCVVEGHELARLQESCMLVVECMISAWVRCVCAG